MSIKLTAGEVADFLGSKPDGDPSAVITGVSKIDQAEVGTLSFLANEKYNAYLPDCKASVVLVNQSAHLERPSNVTLIHVDDAYLSFCRVLNAYFNPMRAKQGISPSAVIDPSAEIGKEVYIGANVVIGQNARIGDRTIIEANSVIGEHVQIGSGCLIYASVTVYHECHVGDDCILHSGTVVGCDGFGHAPQKDGSYIKIPQLGNVVIENNVEIGGNCTIDRATMGSTIIREGVRLDNLIQIAHNVEIDKHTVVAAQSGIAGSTYIGKHCVIAGQVGIVGHIRIADKTQIGAQSGVNHSIEEAGTQLTDSPAFALRDAFKSRVLYRKLPELNNRINQLERVIQQSETKKK
jgi:UDP-3-O-[3-hydroxymyristoyl] glucosamine N-acyltransferase